MKKLFLTMVSLFLLVGLAWAEIDSGLIDVEKERLELEEDSAMAELKFRWKRCKGEHCRGEYNVVKKQIRHYYDKQIRTLRRDPETYFYTKEMNDPDLKIEHSFK